MYIYISNVYKISLAKTSCWDTVGQSTLESWVLKATDSQRANFKHGLWSAAIAAGSVSGQLCVCASVCMCGFVCLCVCGFVCLCVCTLRGGSCKPGCLRHGDKCLMWRFPRRWYIKKRSGLLNSYKLLSITELLGRKVALSHSNNVSDQRAVGAEKWYLPFCILSKILCRLTVGPVTNHWNWFLFLFSRW